MDGGFKNYPKILFCLVCLNKQTDTGLRVVQFLILLCLFRKKYELNVFVLILLRHAREYNFHFSCWKLFLLKYQYLRYGWLWGCLMKHDFEVRSLIHLLHPEQYYPCVQFTRTCKYQEQLGNFARNRERRWDGSRRKRTSRVQSARTYSLSLPCLIIKIQ